MQRRRWRWALLSLAIVLAGVSATLVLERAPAPGFAAGLAADTAAAPVLDRLADALGFGIDEVVLTGHRNTTDREIYDALDLTRMVSFASFESDAIRRNLERLPWIAGAEMTRVWPGRLEVRVHERRPFAVWQMGDQLALVDDAGRVLSAIHRSTDFDVPRIEGDGAPQEAKALFAALERYPGIAREITQSHRVGTRRWSLRLKAGGALDLPADGELAALAALEANPELMQLVSAGDHVIDLRVAGRTAIRRATADRGPGRDPGSS